MAGTQVSKKPRKIRGLTEVVPKVPIFTWVYGKRQPRTEMWATEISDQNETSNQLEHLQNHNLMPVMENQNVQMDVDQPTIFVQDHDGLLGLPLESESTPEVLNETDHAKNRRKRNERWTFLRRFLSHTILEENAPATTQCAVCQETPEFIIRCPDCGPWAYYCAACCIQHHQVITLHKPEQWKDGCFEPFDLPAMIWKRPKHQCLGFYQKPMLLLDDKGCPHWQTLEFCRCEEEPFTLARYGFWPATPINPYIAVSIQLLITFRSLVFAGQVSLTAFSASLKHRYETQYSMNLDVYTAINWDMVLNFMLVYHEVTSLETVIPDLARQENCPACPKDKKVISMDGNFKLVRRRAAGSSASSEERHPDRFFFKQHNVDAFVENYTDTASQKKTCSDFQAGNVLRSKNRNEKLEVKGVFGSVCRHDYPYKFMDLKHGERLAYPVYLLREIKDQARMIMYDIACQLHTHLKKRNENLDGVTLAVPIFHVYGHKMDCQVCYSPRRIQEAGLCDGEGTERLWSFLGEFSNITKEMNHGNRRDLITELLLHYSAKLTNQMVSAFTHKMERACLTLESTESELLKMLASFPADISRDQVGIWATEEREAMVAEIHENPDDWRNSYVLLLEEYYAKKEKMIQNDYGQIDADGEDSDDENDEHEELSRIESKLRRTEKKMKTRRWEENSAEYIAQLMEACEAQRKSRLVEIRDEVVQYVFLTEIRKRYSDGQALAVRITKQVIASSKRLDAAIQRYNSTPQYGRGEYSIPRSVAINLESAIYSSIWNVDQGDFPIPGPLKRKAIDIYQLNQRAREEIGLVSKDMICFTRSVNERALVLSTWLEDKQEIDHESRFNQGCISRVKKALDDLSVIQSQVERYFGPITKSSEVNVTKFVQHLKYIDGESSLKGKGKLMVSLLKEIAQLAIEEESNTVL